RGALRRGRGGPLPERQPLAAARRARDRARPAGRLPEALIEEHDPRARSSATTRDAGARRLARARGALPSPPRRDWSGTMARLLAAGPSGTPAAGRCAATVTST